MMEQMMLETAWTRKMPGSTGCSATKKKPWYLAFSVSVIIPSFDATGKFCVHLRPRVLQSFERMVKCLSNLYLSTWSELISLFEWFKYLLSCSQQNTGLNGLVPLHLTHTCPSYRLFIRNGLKIPTKTQWNCKDVASSHVFRLLHPVNELC